MSPLKPPSRPVFTTELPSSGKIVKYHPFRGSEQTILLLGLQTVSDLNAQVALVERGIKPDGKGPLDSTDNPRLLVQKLQSEITRSLYVAVVEMMKNCVEDVDPATLPTFDIDYLFLQLRSVSVDNKVTFSVVAGKTTPECDECEKARSLTVDFRDIKVQKTDGHTNKIEVDGGSTVLVMRYPNMEEAAILERMRLSGDVDDFEDFTAGLITTVVQGEKIFEVGKDLKKEDLLEYVNNLLLKDHEKLDHFFHTMPELRHVMKTKCPKCGLESEVLLRGIADFLV